MLPQRLISPCFSFHPSFSAPSPPVPVHYSHSLQVEMQMEPLSKKEMEMEPQQGELHEEEEFVVDDLLDFGGLTETEKQEEVIDGYGKDNAHNSNPSVFSPVSFDPSPLSELVPTHDAAELEWVSRLMDDSISEFPASAIAFPAVKPAKEVTSYGCLQATKTKAKRSKRSRTRSPSASWSSWGSPDSSSSSSVTTTTASSSCSSSSYSSPLIFLPFPSLPKVPKKHGRKPKAPGALHSEGVSGESVRTAAAAAAATATERRCSHCGVSKTPQWRAGPAGAKTLCNACGVRFKSGRLLPEYRPACSPTFVSHVHSNSHRKVLEMRRKKEASEVEEDDNPVLVYSAPAVASV